MKGASSKADFWHGKNIDHAEKKAQNSDLGWGPLHAEIGLLKKQILFFASFINFYERELGKTQLIRKQKWHFPSK